MPRENKKRGKRGDKKRKHEEVAEEDVEASKRVRVEDEPVSQNSTMENRDFEPLDQGTGGEELYVAGVSQGTERAFYGMLDEDEAEYFRKADDMLELDDFADPEERTLFLDNVFKEADGKELKIACSQSSSRLMERLINLSNPRQLNKLFQKFNGQLVFIFYAPGTKVVADMSLAL
jgi:nucleolar protein 9